jgi:aminoglycoside phosphotransferase (APT) family kinase protein
MKTNFQSLCNVLNLGTIIDAPSSVSGGLLHKMWYMKTTAGEYAVKELNPVIMAKIDACKNYEMSEKVARIFYEHRIPAVISITNNGHSLIEIEGNFFIVYPWIEGEIVPADAINKIYAQKIGGILAKIHSLNINVPEFNNVDNVHSDDYLRDLLNRVSRSNISFSKELNDIGNKLLLWNQEYRNAVPLLSNEMTVSHGDLDQKNVLWTDDNPRIIDWEGVHKLNPTREIVSVALDWSGLQSSTIDLEVMGSILHAYKNAGGIINRGAIVPAFWYIVGSWLNWLTYNIERSFEAEGIFENERKLGSEQVHKTIRLLEHLVSMREKILIKIDEIV